IRDRNVTGVQTCALPILVHLTNDNFAYIVDSDDSNENFLDEGNRGQTNSSRKQFPVSLRGVYVDVDKFDKKGDSDTSVTIRPFRSEERRVGKECRYRRVR